MSKLDKISKITDKYKELNVVIKNNKNYINVREALYLKNTENPAEVVEKMNMSVPLYGYLGSMKAELEYIVQTLEDNFNIWLEKKKNEFEEKSEKGLERKVIVKYEDAFNNKQEEIRDAKYLLRQVDVTRKTFKAGIEILRSIGRQLTNERENPDPDNYDIKNSSGKIDED